MTPKCIISTSTVAFKCLKAAVVALFLCLSHPFSLSCYFAYAGHCCTHTSGACVISIRFTSCSCISCFSFVYGRTNVPERSSVEVQWLHAFYFHHLLCQLLNFCQGFVFQTSFERRRHEICRWWLHGLGNSCAQKLNWLEVSIFQLDVYKLLTYKFYKLIYHGRILFMYILLTYHPRWKSFKPFFAPNEKNRY